MTPRKIDEIHQQLREGVEALVSDDDWRRALDVAARFHRYSFHNVLLIAMQRPDATQVAGYRKWQEFGRQVRRGEKGIVILAPRLRWEEIEETGERYRRLVGFFPVAVFDVSQTDGEPIASVEKFVRRLEGDAPGALWEALAEQVAAAGFRLSREVPTVRGANGETDWLARTVRVAPSCSPAQSAKTLAHELSHILLEHGNGVFSRSRKEVEAESVAYIVCQALGLDSASYSFGYVAGWSGGKAKAVEETGARVMATAKKILDVLNTDAEREAA